MTYDAHYDNNVRNRQQRPQHGPPQRQPSQQQYHVPVPIPGMPSFIENYAPHAGTNIVDWPHLTIPQQPGMLVPPNMDTFMPLSTSSSSMTSTLPPSSSSSESTASLRISPLDGPMGDLFLQSSTYSQSMDAYAEPETSKRPAGNVSQSTKTEKRSRRVPVACQECRARKSRCDGGRPCSVCVSSGHGDACKYQHSSRRVWILQSEWLALEEERDELRKRCAGLQAQMASDGASSRLTGRPRVADWEANDLQIGSGRLLVDDAGFSRYMGETSGAAFYSSLIDILPKLLPAGSTSPIRAPHPSHQYQSWDSRPLQVSRQPAIDLPPLPLAKRLIGVFRQRCLDPWSWIEPEQLDRLVGEIYGANNGGAPLRPQNQDHLWRFALLYVVLALGAMFDEQRQDVGEAPGMQEYFSRAYALMNGFGGRASVDRVRVLSLAAWYLIGALRRDTAFAFIGEAMRMAISLGMHRKDAEQSAANVEERRRLFWSAVCLDWLVSCTQGRPMQLSSDEIDVPLPSESHNLLEHIKTCMIASRIATGLYASRQGRHYYSIESAHQLLSEVANLSPIAGHTGPLLQLHRLGVISIITRPSVLTLLSVRGTPVAGSVAVEIRQLARRCVVSARESAQILGNLASQQGGIQAWGFYETHFAYNAGVILAVSRLVETDDSREHDDEHLRTVLRVLDKQASAGNASATSSLAILHALEAFQRRVQGTLSTQFQAPMMQPPSGSQMQAPHSSGSGGWYGLNEAQAAAVQQSANDGDSAALQALLGSFT